MNIADKNEQPQVHTCFNKVKKSNIFISRRQKRVTPSISVEEGSPTAEPITEITPGNTPEKKGKCHNNYFSKIFKCNTVVLRQLKWQHKLL